MAGKKKKSTNPGVLGVNRKARYEYAIEETLECGVELRGTEVKSLKLGMFSFADAFVDVRDGELWLRNLHVTPYSHGNIHNHEPIRHRRLLAHKQEIKRLDRRVNERGYTLIPTKFYLVKGRVKVEIGLAKGKKMADKRETIKHRDQQRDMEREFRGR